MNIILIAGKAGSGKNEVAKKIKDKLPATLITSFSKYIKLYALEYTDWDGRDITKPRKFLQEMGDKLRAYNEDFLINRLKEDINIYKQDYQNIIISDVRLINEIEKMHTLKDHKIISIKVVSNNNKRELTKEELNHKTEIELENYNNFDYIIENNALLDDEVNKIIEGMI